MTELWTPSDEILLTDEVAKAKINNPHDLSDLEAVGALLPDAGSDEANEAAAAVALAEIDDSEPDRALGICADDDAIEDFDEMPVGDDV